VESDWAKAFLRDAQVWDAHAGIFPVADADLSGVTEWTAAGVNYVSINIGFDVIAWQDSMRVLEAYRIQLGAMTDSVLLVRTVQDIDRATQQGKLAISFDVEGANALNGNIDLVSTYHSLGVRQMLLAYNLDNDAAGGCHGQDIGLKPFGKAIVKELNCLGIIVDCSHAGYRTSLDIIDCSEQPIVFTHSNPIALCDHQRNIQDDQIRACAETGGVVGINGMGIFLGNNDIRVETFTDHVCYVADLAGPEHVGFGLDFKPAEKAAVDLNFILASRPDYWPSGQRYDTPNIELFSPANMAAVLCLLRQRGWSDTELHGFLGGNFRRVAEQVWH
jgi:membrane dipeptidase